MISLLIPLAIFAGFNSFETSEDSVYLGERFSIVISYSHPRDCSVSVVSDSSLWHPFIIENSPIKELLTRGEDSLSSVFTFSGAIFSQVDSSLITIPPAIFYFPDTSYTDTLHSFNVHILSVLSGPEDTILCPLRPRLDLPPKPPEPLYKKLFRLTLRFWYVPLIIIGAVLVAGAAYALIKRSAKKKFFVLSPKEKAMMDLSNIFKSYLKDKPEVSKDFYEELSEVFKEYSEKVSTLKTKKMTVKEIQDIFLKSFYVSKEIQKALSSFNRASELAKFSKEFFSSEKGNEDFEAVRDFVWVFPLVKIGEDKQKDI
ncbi:hypothetical protein JW890_08205 [candidate division WOR-3 bacterium]|nr:hypothetical protein [candidate division WOR-3 bacterium]